MTQDTARQYSLALLQAADSDEKLKAWGIVLQQLVQIFQGSPDILQFFFSPAIDLSQKQALIQKTLKASLDSQIFLLLNLLIKEKRLNLLPLISKELSQLILEKQNSLEATFILTMPLQKGVKEKLKEKLEKLYKKTLVIKEEINPQLLGGGILLIDGKILDFSVQGKLKKLKNHLLSVHL